MQAKLRRSEDTDYRRVLFLLVKREEAFYSIGYRVQFFGARQLKQMLLLEAGPVDVALGETSAVSKEDLLIGQA